MSLLEEYKIQSTWRDWNPYIEKLPIDQGDNVLDLGCSIGTVSKLLAEKAHHVVGIDHNPELLEEAERINATDNISYLNLDLGSSACEGLPPFDGLSLFDGIWSSFTAAYFPDFEPVLNVWKKVLREGGWMALVEIYDLFSHEPVSKFTRDTFENYALRQCRNNMYDFKMGGKLKDFMTGCGLSIIHEEDMFDPELAFNGPASTRILKAWENRFDRMVKFREYVRESAFQRIKLDFLNGLSDQNHTSNTAVKFIIARKYLKQ